MFKRFSGAIAGLVAAMGSIGAAHAVVINPGFETGDLTGWASIGDVSIVDSTFGSGPSEGTFQALLTTGAGAVGVADLEGFLGVESGALSTFSGETVTQGSAIKQTVTVTPGETLSFDFNFLTDEIDAPGVFNDLGFAIVNSTFDVLADTFSPLIPSTTIFDDETDFQNFLNGPFILGDTFTVAFGVVDVGDTVFDSALLVDSSASTAVPEPATLSFLGIALIGAGFAARRRSRKALA